MHLVMGDIAERGITVTPSNKCEEIYSIFINDTSLEGIVILHKDQPLGLVMRTLFFQKLSTKYGFDLFMKRTIDLVMDQELLVVDYHISLTEVSSLAMNRKQGNLYDLVIVMKYGKFYGVVSIRELIIKLSEIQISIARYANPLSGLPGNFIIEETLKKVLSYKKYTVLYLDLDSFKSFNDTYGFREGDELIKETAQLISDVVVTNDNEPSFVGHIGGDDFIAVLPHHRHKQICNSIISRFDQTKLRFYSKKDLQNGYVKSINRAGVLENVPLVSISIAVITNKRFSYQTVEDLSRAAAMVKQKCKTITKSVCICIEDLAEIR